MTVHHARVIVLAAVLVGIALVPSPRLHARPPLADGPSSKVTSRSTSDARCLSEVARLCPSSVDPSLALTQLTPFALPCALRSRSHGPTPT